MSPLDFLIKWASAGNFPAGDYYKEAKEVAQSLFSFPYENPDHVSSLVAKHKNLFQIIKETYPTTINYDGNKQQTTIDAVERMRLQDEFKKVIYDLLEKCLEKETEHVPAMLLYGRVAEFNTRKRHVPQLIELYERFLPSINKITNESTGYSLIKEEIKDMGGNCFDKVERHIADFYCELSRLYHKGKLPEKSRLAYKHACALCPTIYGLEENKINPPY